MGFQWCAAGNLWCLVSGVISGVNGQTGVTRSTGSLMWHRYRSFTHIDICIWRVIGLRCQSFICIWRVIFHFLYVDFRKLTKCVATVAKRGGTRTRDTKSCTCRLPQITLSRSASARVAIRLVSNDRTRVTQSFWKRLTNCNHMFLLISLLAYGAH